MEKERKQVPQYILDKLNAGNMSPFEKYGVDLETRGEDLIQQLREISDQIFTKAIEKNEQRMRQNLEKLGLSQEEIEKSVQMVENENDQDHINYAKRRQLITGEINQRTNNTLNSLPTNSVLEEIRKRIRRSR